MNNLNALKNKVQAMKNSFTAQHTELVVSGKMSISDFAALTLELVHTIAAFEKAIKELSNGLFTFNSNDTVSVTYLSNFRNGRYHQSLESKTVVFSFLDCLRNLKGLNINKHLLLRGAGL